MTATAAILLFSYGTLQDKSVQVAHLPHHPIVAPSPNPADEVPGTVFEITAPELAAADKYEVSDYKRVSVSLKSGLQAWVYVRA